MVTKNNQKESLNASIKEVTTAIDNQARQNLSKNPTKTPSPNSILKKRLAALQKRRNALNKNNNASPMNYSMQTRSKSKSSGSRRSSVGSASTPLTNRQKQIVNVVKRLGFPRINNNQLRGSKLASRFIKNAKGEERVRVGQEAKNARDAMNLRGLSRRLAARAGVISPLSGIKKTLNNLRRSERIQKKVNKSPKSKGSVTKKPKSM
tara:strand:- start:3 stop:623 length:621 start_codon:yes stop_codon:yes gene_type:complete